MYGYSVSRVTPVTADAVNPIVPLAPGANREARLDLKLRARSFNLRVH
jgi:hypothetical protein